MPKSETRAITSVFLIERYSIFLSCWSRTLTQARDKPTENTAYPSEVKGQIPQWWQAMTEGGLASPVNFNSKAQANFLKLKARREKEPETY